LADAVIPRWHGDNYQARIFWENALNLLDKTSCVVEVTFEADGPKAFDDVVVKYDPPVARSGPDRVVAEYHQVKWHVEYGGRFGFEDFVDPTFIGAKSISLLERLKNARYSSANGSRFAFITTYRAKDGDQLGELISGHDKSLLLEKLFDGTTDKSRMGQVRKLWREHLALANDDELRSVLQGFRVLEGHRSLEELRSQINLRAQVVGMLAYGDASSDFRYDELARQLKARGLNGLTRETLEQLCRDEGLFAPIKAGEDLFLSIAVRSFLGPAADIVGATPEHTLILTDDFRQRYLRDDLDWQIDIRPKVQTFLRERVAGAAGRLRLIVDAHASIAFLAGATLDLKSGVTTELVQKGRVGTRTWRAGDGSADAGPELNVVVHDLGAGGREIAAAISISQATESQARAYVTARLPRVGRLVAFTMPTGPGQQVVAGGAHAAALAEQISNVLRGLKTTDPDAVVHIFAACPNALLFFLGQQHQSIAPCIVYEFDFDRRGDKTYQPSFTID
jgi:hypothetical protein